MFSNLRHGIHPRPICSSAPSGTDNSVPDLESVYSSAPSGTDSSLLDLETEPDSDDDYWEEDENGNLVAIVYMDVDEELEMID